MIRASLRIAVLLCVLASLAGPGPAFAQARSSPYSVEADPFLHIDAKVETPFVIGLSPEAAAAKQAMVLIRGLSSAFSLTEGRLFDSGVWAVGVADLPRLKIVASPRAAGSQTPLTLSLVALDGTLLARGAMTVVVKQPGGVREVNAAPAAAAPLARGAAGEAPMGAARNHAAQPSSSALALASPAPGEAPARPAAPSLSPREEAERLKSAEAALALDDIAGARLILEYLARRGSAAGAYRLAQTYDPDLARRGTGARAAGDESLAATWYAKAAELGHPQAREKVGAR